MSHPAEVITCECGRRLVTEADWLLHRMVYPYHQIAQLVRRHRDCTCDDECDCPVCETCGERHDTQEHYPITMGWA